MAPRSARSVVRALGVVVSDGPPASPVPVSTPRPGITAVLVVVPAHDEEERIGACLGSVRCAVLELRRVRPEILVQVTVVLDGCTDLTATVAARIPEVALLTIDAHSVGSARRAGVTDAVQQLGGHDPARVLVVNTDADSIVPAGWLVGHVDLAADHDVVLGEVEPDAGEVTPTVLARWWAANPVGRGSLHGANLAVRLDAYLRAGGFPEVTRQEDVLLVRALRARGAAVIGGGRIVTSGRRAGRAPGGFAAYLDALTTDPSLVP